jgi:hypothetical protein
MLWLEMSKAESLRAQDVLVACKLFSLAEARRDWTYSVMAGELGLSAGETHNAVDRCRCAGLLLPSREISSTLLRDLLVVAVPRIFYAIRGGIVTGMPTSVHATSLKGRFNVARGVRLVVWPGGDAGSPVPNRSGEAVAPIYPSVPGAARRDVVIYELLALVDVLRVGSATEQERAVQCLDERLLAARPSR